MTTAAATPRDRRSRSSAGGLATSSVTVRRSGTGAGLVHHLIDPASGRPVDGPWRTVSVTAASCLDANIASTAAIVLGADALEWLEVNQPPGPPRRPRRHRAATSPAGRTEGDDL